MSQSCPLTYTRNRSRPSRRLKQSANNKRNKVSFLPKAAICFNDILAILRVSVELTHFYARRIVDFTIEQNPNLHPHHKLILENNLNMPAPPEVALSI